MLNIPHHLHTLPPEITRKSERNTTQSEREKLASMALAPAAVVDLTAPVSPALHW